MANESERQLKYKEQRSREAIEMAMQANWQEAVEINREIIENLPENVEAYNRLGRAYMELGQYQLSREAYQRSAELDPYNAIASRNLRRLNDLKETGQVEIETEKVEPQRFIEEIGKAGVVTLEELAPKEERAGTVAGDKATLKISGSYLVVETPRGDYLGSGVRRQV